MGWSRHEDIGAWQRAEELCGLVRKLCEQRSFNSDPSDFAKFVRIAKSSEVELLAHFNEAVESRHITEAERATLDHAAKKAIKAANGLIRWLENSPDP